MCLLLVIFYFKCNFYIATNIHIFSIFNLKCTNTGKNLKQTVITSEIILYHFVFHILLKEKKIPPVFKLKKVHMLFFST